MTRMDEAGEQHIVEYQARLKHFDELLEQAEQGKGREQVEDELAQLRQERQQLLDEVEEIKRKTREEWQEETIEEAGPMILWEAVAKRLEKLIERIER